MQVRIPGGSYGVPRAVEGGSPQPIGSKSKRRPGPRVTMRNAEYAHRFHASPVAAAVAPARAAALRAPRRSPWTPRAAH
eukprot:3509446-Alexandrium_andersonii.AAC.1